MNKYYLVENSKIELDYVTKILKVCNGENGILASIFNCVFQELMLEGNGKLLVQRKILLKIVNAKSNEYKALHRILKELGVKEYARENLGLESAEKFICTKEDFNECLKFNIELQNKILNDLQELIQNTKNSQHAKVLTCIFEIEKNNKELFFGLMYK